MYSFLNISGNSFGISIQSLGQINSQYVSTVDLEAQEHENINNKPTFHVKDIINFTLIISSLVIFIISFVIFWHNEKILKKGNKKQF